MKNIETDIVVVGNGIAAKLAIFELQQVLAVTTKILQIDANDIFAACSDFSTSYVSTHGIKSGVSDLGDTVCTGVDATLSFIDKWRPDGTYHAAHYKLPGEGENKSEFLRRFNACYNIFKLNEKICLKEIVQGVEFPSIQFDYNQFSQWIDHKNSAWANFSKLKSYVASGDFANGNLLLVNNQKITSKIILFCTGAYSKLLTQTLFAQMDNPNDLLGGTQNVPGNYLQFKSVLWGENSFNLSCLPANLIYRAESATLLIGGTSNSAEIYATDFLALQKQYEIFNNLLPAKLLPELNTAEILTGNRHKGKKRRPFWGGIYHNEKHGLYASWGYYKNGFSVPFHSSKILAVDIKKRLGLINKL